MGKTLKDLRVDAGWTKKMLYEKSGVDTGTISRVERGAKIGAVKAKAMADALSSALGREIVVSDIEGLNVE